MPSLNEFLFELSSATEALEQHNRHLDIAKDSKSFYEACNEVSMPEDLSKELTKIYFENVMNQALYSMPVDLEMEMGEFPEEYNE